MSMNTLEHSRRHGQPIMRHNGKFCAPLARSPWLTLGNLHDWMDKHCDDTKCSGCGELSDECTCMNEEPS